MSIVATSAGSFPACFLPRPLDCHDLEVFASDFAIAASLVQADRIRLFPADGDGELSLPEGSRHDQAITWSWKKKKTSRLAPGDWLVVLENSLGEFPGAVYFENVHNETDLEQDASLVARLLGHEFERIKWSYVDCATGLLNGQYFKKRFFDLCGEQEGATYFFFSLLAAKKDISAQPLVVAQAAAAVLSRAFSSVIPVVSFGGGLFCAIAPPGENDIVRAVARNVVEQFRSWKWRSACCAIVEQEEGTGLPKDLEPAFSGCLALGWSTLEKAHRFGPFSVCFAAEEESDALRLLRTLPQEIARVLRKQMAAQPCFSLVLFEDDVPAPDRTPLVDLLKTMTEPQEHVISCRDGRVCVLLPHLDAATGEKRVARFQEYLCQSEQDLSKRSVTVGIASFPDNGFSKAAVTENVVKALLHARFFAPSGRTLFDHVSLNVSGDAYFNHGNFTAAMREYQYGLEKKPEDINLLNSAGVACGQCNRHDRAASFFMRVLEQAPDNFMALANLGHSSLFHGEREKALHFFEKCLATSTLQSETTVHELYDVLVLLARLLFLHNRSHDALDLLDTWWDKSPSSQVAARMYAVKGEICIDEHKQDDARKYLQEAQKLQPYDPNIMSLLAVAYALGGNNRDVAVSLCEKAIEGNKMKKAFWRRKGHVFLLQSEPAQAKKAVAMACVLNKNDSHAIYLMGCIAENSGQMRQATRYYQKVLTLRGASPLSQRKARAALARL